MKTQQADLRSIIRLVAIFNLAYFGIEFAVALAIGSVSLFADSIDFLEEPSKVDFRGRSHSVASP